MINVAIGTSMFLVAVGAFGVMTRKNMILIFLSIELMLFGVSLSFIAHSLQHNDVGGQVFALMILGIAACEAGLALALTVLAHRCCRSLDIDLWRQLSEVDRPESDHKIPEPTSATDENSEYPKLVPAGRVPNLYEETYS